MVTVIVRHWIQPDKLERVKSLILQNGKLMQSAPGFVMRHTMIARADPLQVTTVTGWRTDEDYQGWLKQREAKRAQSAPPENLYTKPPETTVFSSIPELP